MRFHSERVSNWQKSPFESGHRTASSSEGDRSAVDNDQSDRLGAGMGGMANGPYRGEDEGKKVR